MTPTDLAEENRLLKRQLFTVQRRNGQLRKLMARYAPEVKWEPNPHYRRKGVSPFEKLAPELRNMVCGELLVCDSTIIIARETCASQRRYRLVSWVNSRPPRPWHTRLPGVFGVNGAALLCLNKAIYEEALSYLYESNRFAADNYQSFTQFMTGIGIGSKLVRDIGTRYWSEVHMRKLASLFTDDIIGKLTTFRICIDDQPNKHFKIQGDDLIDSLFWALKPFVMLGESNAECRKRFSMLQFEHDGSTDVNANIKRKLVKKFNAAGASKTNSNRKA